MELVILGFLLIRTLSQYEIKKAMGKELSPYYSPSLGSIQTTLKKLIEKGLITLDADQSSGRKKNLYTITEQGIVYFKQLMQSEFSDQKFEAESSTRLFFLGHLNKEDRMSLIQNIIIYLDEKLSDFEKERVNAEEVEIEEKYKKIVKYQLSSLSLAYSQYKCALRFYNNLLEEMSHEY